MSEFGEIRMDPRDDVVAGSRVTLTFTYTVGPAGMRRGGGLRIRTPNDGWGTPMAHLKAVPKRIEMSPFEMADGYVCERGRSNLSVTLESCDPEAKVELTAESGAGPLSKFFVATVAQGALVKGDVIRVVYGDRTWGEDGVAAAEVAPTPDDRFVAHVDVAGNGHHEPLDDTRLEIRVRPGPVSQFNMVAPAIVKPGEPFDVTLSGLDAYRNKPEAAWTGDIRLGTTNPDLAMPGSLSLNGSDANLGAVREARALAEGVYVLTAEPSVGGTRSRSNPIWARERDLKVYFGDLHTHSMYHGNGRSIGTPDEMYTFGRDVAGLDFMAITDGGGERGEGWVPTQEVTNRYNDPGRFVTFKGYENGYGRGHRNVIYRNCDVEPNLDLPGGFFEYYRGRQDVMSIPHHTKAVTDWDFFDPELEPLVEVYSCWGSGVAHADPLWNKSEKPGSGVFNALARGYRLGFIGSGDSHAGTPGRSHSQDRQWLMHQKSGFACVYAPELTREAIFDALRARHCYATTGVRAILEFSINDVPMGGELRMTDDGEPRVIRVHAIGTEALEVLTVIKNNVELCRRELDRQEEFFEYHDTARAMDGDFYYARVTQEDGNAIWSSPIWVGKGDRG